MYCYNVSMKCLLSSEDIKLTSPMLTNRFCWGIFCPATSLLTCLKDVLPMEKDICTNCAMSAENDKNLIYLVFILMDKDFISQIMCVLFWSHCCWVYFADLLAE